MISGVFQLILAILKLGSIADFIPVSVIKGMLINNLVKTAVIQNAWNRGVNVTIHGWVYDMQTGLVSSLLECDKDPDIFPIYRY